MLLATGAMNVVAQENCFNDCTSDDCGDLGQQLYTAVQYLCERGIVEGVNGNLNPDDDITRAQLAKVSLFGLYDGPDNIPNPLVTDYFPCIYPDMQENTYYYQAAKALLYLEYGDGRSPFDRNRVIFNPTGTITRCLVLKVLLETFNIAPATEGSNPFSDFDPSESFWGYAKKAYDLNIVQTSDFRPHENCTRGEAFVFLYRIMINNTSKSLPNYDPNDPFSSDFFIPTNLSPAVVNTTRGVENGNFNYYEKSFFNIPGYMDLDFGIAYNSYLTEMPDDMYPVKPMGRAWTHNYDMYMNVVADYYNNTTKLVFHMQNGSLLVYNQDLSKVTQGDYSTLTPSGTDKYILKSPDQMEYTFQRFSTSDGIYYLTKINDRNDNCINSAYENGIAHYRISSVTTLGRTLSFNYTTNTDLVSSVNDPINRTVCFYYTNGELTSLKDAKNQTTSFSYGTTDLEKGLLTEITLPRGNKVYNIYQQRKLTSTQYNDGTPTTVNITPNYQSGNISSVVTQPLDNGQNMTANYLINGENRVTRFMDDQSTDISYAYDNGSHPALVSSMKDNKTNVQTYYSYNSSGLMTQKIFVAGGQTITMKCSFNEANDITSYTDGNGNVTRYEYDGNGNLTKITDALNHFTNISNNSYGVPTQITDASGKTTNLQYNSYGNVEVVNIPSLNLSSTTSYDGVSRITSNTDFGGHQTSYTYDNNDNILTETNALGKTTTYTFDANDNLTQVTNALGNATYMTYDNDDLLSSASFQGYTRSYTHNINGSINTYTSPNGYTFSYTYNDEGKMTSDGYATYEYNNRGLLASVTKDGNALIYTYDAFGRPVTVTYDVNTVCYTYDNNSNVTSIIYPGNKIVTYTYDALNRITSVKDWNNAITSYDYRDDGLINYYQYPNAVRTTFSYDTSGRCTGMATKRNDGNGSTIAQYSFVLDNSGNHISESIAEPFDSYPYIPTDNATYSYDAANRLISAGDLTFNYDNNGNNTSRTGRNYNFDEKDNLIGVTGDFTASYTYDGLGNRRSATRNGVTRKYTLDLLNNNAVLVETDVNGNVIYYYIYGPSGLISRINASNETRYYVYDYRGSTVAMTDANNAANITHKYQYDDFGKLLRSIETDENPFRFVGKYGVMYENDALTFMRARYYDPEIGRFLSEDPVWSTYLYSYADNNPITGIDPEGKSTQKEIDGVLKNTIIGIWSEILPAKYGKYKFALYGIDYAVHGTTWRQVISDIAWEVAGVSKLLGWHITPIKVEVDLIKDYVDAVETLNDATNKLAIATVDLHNAERISAQTRRQEDRNKLFGMLEGSNDNALTRWINMYRIAKNMPEEKSRECYDQIYREMKQSGY